MQTNIVTDALGIERSEIDILIDRGVQFQVPKRSFLRFLSKKKERSFTIYQPYAGTLDILSSLFLEMEVDEEKIAEDPLGESKRMVGKSAKLAGKVVAVAVLNGKWKIKLFSGILSRYFFWRVTPSTLFQLALTINTMANYRDFISSIRLMSAARTTKPNLIEAESKKA